MARLNNDENIYYIGRNISFDDNNKRYYLIGNFEDTKGGQKILFDTYKQAYAMMSELLNKGATYFNPHNDITI